MANVIAIIKEGEKNLFASNRAIFVQHLRKRVMALVLLLVIKLLLA